MNNLRVVIILYRYIISILIVDNINNNIMIIINVSDDINFIFNNQSIISDRY